jgi:hypothetical protein
MIIEIKGKCQYEGCNKNAKCIASGRSDYDGGGHQEVGVYCIDHARIVADERNPEYIDDCPNCGCMFGVN